MIKNFKKHIQKICPWKTIGKKLIQITEGLQLQYLAYDIKKDEVFAEKYNVKYCDLSFLLENADIISFHLNLAKENKNLLNINKLNNNSEKLTFCK